MCAIEMQRNDGGTICRQHAGEGDETRQVSNDSGTGLYP